VTSPENTAASVQQADVRPRRLALFGAVAVLALMADLVSKLLVVKYLPETHPQVRLLGGAIYLDQARNSGAAFSVGTGFTVVLTAVSTCAGIAVGVAGASARTFGPKWIGGLVAAYVELIRNTPFIVQLFFIFFGLPAAGIKLSRRNRRPRPGSPAACRRRPPRPARRVWTPRPSCGTGYSPQPTSR